MGGWMDEPIVDPTIPERDRSRLVTLPLPRLHRPDPVPSRWVRWLLGLGVAVTGTGGALFAAGAFYSDHESAGLAAMMVFLMTVLLAGVARPGPESRLARRYIGRYLMPDELDDSARELLTRARRAVIDVSGSRVNRLGLLDAIAIANDVVLPERLWEIARLLRTHTELRAEQAQALAEEMTPELAAVLEPQQEALARSVAAVTEQVRDLEEYAIRVRAADAALRANELRESDERYRDLLARTGDTEAVARLIDQADALNTILRRPSE